MESLMDLTLWPPTAWHWLALGLLLLTVEMMTGTWDLLWVSIAAGLTSAYAAIAPDGLADGKDSSFFCHRRHSPLHCRANPFSADARKR